MKKERTLMGYVTKCFSKRLKEIRETAGLTQAQLAEQLNVSRGAISYYEKGERTPDIEFLDSLSEYFNLPYDFVLGMTQNVKAEYKNMFELYGLTDDACNELDRSPKTGHLISAILGHKHFFHIKYAYENIIKNYKFFNTSELGYISFLLTDILNKTIFDALETLIDFQFTPEEKEALHLKDKMFVEELDKKIKELDNDILQNKKKHISSLEELKEKDEEENKLRYSAMDKVHEKFYETINDMEIERKLHTF